MPQLRKIPGAGIVAYSDSAESRFLPGGGFVLLPGVALPGNHVNLGNAIDHEIVAGAPTVTAILDHFVDLDNAADHEITVGVINGDVPDQNRVVDLINAVLVAHNLNAPTVDVPTSDDILLPNALDHQINVGAPATDVRVEFQSNLGNAADHEITVGVPPVVAGGEQSVTLALGVVVAVDPPDNIPITAPLLFESNLPYAVVVSTNTGVPTSEGESELPPTIDTPTPNQLFTFNAIGTLPAPVHFVGTGDNPTWTLAVDEMSSQPGVLTWSINPTTGDITYQIAQLSDDPDVQALNTKGPYNITRRLTTTVSFVDESFEVAINIGNQTLQMTPGTKPCYTWVTKTAAARGVEPTKDPSVRVTQTYTVT